MRLCSRRLCSGSFSLSGRGLCCTVRLCSRRLCSCSFPLSGRWVRCAVRLCSRRLCSSSFCVAGCGCLGMRRLCGSLWPILTPATVEFKTVCSSIITNTTTVSSIITTVKSVLSTAWLTFISYSLINCLIPITITDGFTCADGTSVTTVSYIGSKPISFLAVVKEWITVPILFGRTLSPFISVKATAATTSRIL